MSIMTNEFSIAWDKDRAVTGPYTTLTGPGRPGRWDWPCHPVQQNTQGDRTNAVSRSLIKDGTRLLTGHDPNSCQSEKIGPGI